MKRKEFFLPLLSVLFVFISTPGFTNLCLAQDQTKKVLYRGKTGGLLPYKVVDDRPLPANTGMVVLSRKTRTSAGYVKIATTFKMFPGKRRLDQNVQFFDEAGNSTHSKQFEGRKYKPFDDVEEVDVMVNSIHVVSKHGNFVAIRTTVQKGSKEQKGILKNEIFNANNEKLWEEVSEVFYDASLPRLYISDVDGAGVKVDKATGTITFYTSAGEKVKEVHEIKTFDGDHGNDFPAAAFSNDGMYIIVNVTEVNSNASRTIMFNDQGEELWRFRGDNKNGGFGVGITPDNNFILTTDHSFLPGSRTNTTYLLNSEGMLLRKYDGIAYMNVIFSVDSKTAVFGGHSMYIIDLLSGEIMQDFKYSSAKSFDIASERQLVAMIINRQLVVARYDGSPAFVYDFGEEDIRMGSMDSNSPIFEEPIVQISEDGSEIFVRLDKRTVRFQLQN